MTFDKKQRASGLTAKEGFRLPQNGRIEKKWALNFIIKYNENKYCMGQIHTRE